MDWWWIEPSTRWGHHCGEGIWLWAKRPILESNIQPEPLDSIEYSSTRRSPSCVVCTYGINPGIPQSRDAGPFVNPEIPGFGRPNPGILGIKIAVRLFFRHLTLQSTT